MSGLKALPADGLLSAKWLASELHNGLHMMKQDGVAMSMGNGQLGLTHEEAARAAALTRSMVTLLSGEDADKDLIVNFVLDELLHPRAKELLVTITTGGKGMEPSKNKIMPKQKSYEAYMWFMLAPRELQLKLLNIIFAAELLLYDKKLSERDGGVEPLSYEVAEQQVGKLRAASNAREMMEVRDRVVKTRTMRDLLWSLRRVIDTEGEALKRRADWHTKSLDAREDDEDDDVETANKSLTNVYNALEQGVSHGLSQTFTNVLKQRDLTSEYHDFTRDASDSWTPTRYSYTQDLPPPPKKQLTRLRHQNQQVSAPKHVAAPVRNQTCTDNTGHYQHEKVVGVSSAEGYVVLSKYHRFLHLEESDDKRSVNLRWFMSV